MTGKMFPFKYILSDENEGKYQSGDCWLIQYQILQTNIIRFEKERVCSHKNGKISLRITYYKFIE